MYSKLQNKLITTAVPNPSLTKQFYCNFWCIPHGVYMINSSQKGGYTSGQKAQINDIPVRDMNFKQNSKNITPFLVAKKGLYTKGVYTSYYSIKYHISA